MSSVGSITRLIGEARERRATAAQRIWDLFAARLLALARANLPREYLAVADEEDVVVSALCSFFGGVEQGKFSRLNNRKSLWALLARITKRKAQDLLQREGRQRRGSGVRPVSLDSFGQMARKKAGGGGIPLVDPGPSPGLQALMADEIRQLLDLLDDPELSVIVLARLEGRSEEEIAAQLGCAARTVQRKLVLIRQIWSREIQP
jgi:DNA-directed RNA polymerase specialized sigma24 family protein